MSSKDKSFMRFLNVLFSSLEIKLLYFTVIWFGVTLYIIDLIYPSDFTKGGTFYGWWIITISFIIYAHIFGYIIWRNENE